MASSTHNPSVLLKRLLSLKDPSPLYLITDTIAHTAKNSILNEFAFQSVSDLDILYVSFETLNKPHYVSDFVRASQYFQSSQTLVAEVQARIKLLHAKNPNAIILCVFDNIGYIDSSEVAKIVQMLAEPRVSLCAIYHRDNLGHVESQPTGLKDGILPQNVYPSTYDLLKYIATNVLEVYPDVSSNKNIEDEEELESLVSRFSLPKGLNNLHSYELRLINRRKSGRSLKFDFIVNTETHEYVHKIAKDLSSEDASDPSFQGLTTFNLNTTTKQKHAKDQVDLPFLEAQSFNTGGAIVYEFEKDDDYDEEDPFEDPF
ncbi:hypothetical protein ACO0RG_002275 [Hanseniaspora osmophila]|uniref:Elongator complex protein 5 n=1 Tax=Hanseniaspora osmophila TaxID=56408 RepID=A0A1E5RHU6_9ASCO|nr:Elongator complex protein 5 [Hanseniaspora osmophila]